MAYESLTTESVQPGEPVKSDALMDRIRTDLDDLDSRTSTTEASTNLFIPVTMTITGPIDDGVVRDGIAYYRIPSDINVLGARATAVTAGSSGSHQVDIERRVGASFVSLLTGVIDVAAAGGDFTTSSATLATTQLDQGDVIRFNVDAVQAGSPRDLLIEFEFEIRT